MLIARPNGNKNGGFWVFGRNITVAEANTVI